MNNHDFEYVRKVFGRSGGANGNTTPYIQHNRSMKDSIEGVIYAVESFARSFPEFSYNVKHIHIDGEYVTFHSHATLYAKDRGNDTRGLNIMDTWKVVVTPTTHDDKDVDDYSDTKMMMIVEHWDTVQPLDWFMRLYNLFTGGAIRNKNGVF